MALMFLISVVLSRLLPPSEFGLLAMVTIFISFSSVFVHFGFHLALIQSQDVTQEDYCTIFFFNVMIGILLTTIMFLAAPMIADFYGIPIVKQIARALSFLFLLNSLMIIQKTKLEKSLNYKNISLFRIVAVVISGLISISMAFNNYGVWSLVAQNLVTAFVTCALFWYWSAWRPQLIFSTTSFKKYWRYGSNAFGASFVMTIGNQLDNLIVGKVFLQEKLGLYNRGKSLSSLMTILPDSLFMTPLFPALSKIQSEKTRLRDALSKINSTLGFLFIPAFIFVISFSNLFILSIYGTQWIGAVFFLKTFCLIGMLHMILKPNNHLLMIVGKSEMPFKINTFTTALRIIAILILGLQNIYWLMYGLIGVKAIELCIYAFLGSKEIGEHFYYFIPKFIPYILCSVLAWLGASMLCEIIQIKVILIVQLVICFTIYALIYLALILILQPESYSFLIPEVKKILTKKQL